MSPGILVLGCGSIGRRHIANLRLLGIQDIFAFDVAAEPLALAVHESAVVACRSVDDGLARRPDIALICTPPVDHIRLASQAVAVGCHVFVEKPLAAGLDGVDDLLAEAARQGRTVYVGYNLRFHAGLMRVKEMLDKGAVGRVLSIQAEFGQYLPDWRPGQDYRCTYTARAAMGGGIILDASHELDYVRWLGGEVQSVACAAGKVSSLEMDVEDTADITLQLLGPVIANIHVDCIQRFYSRWCKVIGEEGTVVWDYKTGVRHYEARRERWHEESIAPEPNEMYVEEMRHFLAAVEGEAAPLVDGATGKRVLEIALAAKRSAQVRAAITL